MDAGGWSQLVNCRWPSTDRRTAPCASIKSVPSNFVSKRPVVFTFGLLTGLFASGYGVMFTVLDDFRDEYGIGGTALGMIVAMGFFASFLAQVLIAPLADRGYARRLVYIGMLLNIVGLVAMAIATNAPALFAARFVMGIGAGMAVPAVRRIVILADPTNLGANLGRLLAADVSGFAMGPAIAAVLVGPFGIAAPFLMIAVLTVACLPVIARVRVDENLQAPRAKLAFDLLRIRSFAGAVMLGAAVFMMIGTFDALWVLVLSDLRAADWLANLGITMFALPMIVLSPTGGRMAQRVGPFRLATIGLVAGAGYMFLYGYMPTGMAMMAVGVMHAITDGLTISSTGVAVGLAVPGERQAGAQGLMGGAQTLVGGVTAVTAGAIYQHVGRTAAYTAAGVAMLVFVAGALLLIGPTWKQRPLHVSAAPELSKI